jgi:hypothetical protein
MRRLISILILCRWLADAVKLAGIDQKNLPSFSFPSYDYHDILILDPSTAIKISHDLTSLGFLQIKNIPRYADARLAALKSAHQCFQSKTEDGIIQRNTMADGSLRLTASALSSNGIGGALSSACAQTSSSNLRALVDNVSRQVFRMLDAAAVSPSNQEVQIMKPYRSYSDLITHGDHLEHLHVYYPSSSDNPQQQLVDQPTLDLHTDNGIMIAMTAGYYAGDYRTDEHGLYVELPTGQVCRASVDEDSLVLMVGAGSRWLSPMLGAPLRAVPHAMVAGIHGEDSSRAWFGKMILPPADAIIMQDGKATSFQQYRHLITTASDEHSHSLPTGCGSYDASAAAVTNPYMHLSTSQCTAEDGSAGLTCWTQCYSVADLPCGLDAQCVYLATNEVVDGDKMCPDHDDGACQLECVDSDADNTSTTSSFDGYCYGSGTSMLMDGFTMMAFSNRGSVPCINLLFTSWTMDTNLKFAFGCVGVFLISVTVQWMTMFRQKIKKGKTKTSVYANSVFTVLVYGIQVVLSYFIMLAAMTYSVELFTMVCVGLTVGYAAFNMEQPATSPDQCCDLDIDIEDMDKNKDMYHKLSDPDAETNTESVNN